MLSKKRLFPFIALFAVILLVAACEAQAQTVNITDAPQAAEAADSHAEAKEEEAHTEEDEHADEMSSDDAAHQEGDSHAPDAHMAEMGMHAEGDEHGVPARAMAVENPVPATDDSIAAGAATYTQYCAVCHGNEGKGDGPGAAALNPKPADFSAEHVQILSDGGLFWFISNGAAGTAMPPWKEILSERQRWEAVNFLRTFENH